MGDWNSNSWGNKPSKAEIRRKQAKQTILAGINPNPADTRRPGGPRATGPRATVLGGPLGVPGTGGRRG